VSETTSDNACQFLRTCRPSRPMIRKKLKLYMKCRGGGNFKTLRGTKGRRNEQKGLGQGRGGWIGEREGEVRGGTEAGKWWAGCSPTLYSRRAGVSGFWRHRLERPASPRRVCAVTRGFQTTTIETFLFSRSYQDAII